jgi:hypothetical protein
MPDLRPERQIRSRSRAAAITVRRGRASRAWSAVALAAGALLSVAVLAAAQGEVKLSGGDNGWAQACAGQRPREDRELLARCAYVRGRVLWTGHQSADPHVAVLAAFHLFVVKLTPGTSMPRPGAAIAVTGALVRARNGFREVQAWSVDR